MRSQPYRLFRVLTLSGVVALALFPPLSVHAATEFRSVVIDKIPHVHQRSDFCGEACAAMYLQRLGKTYSQDHVYNISGLDPVHGRGCYTRELRDALLRIGFNVGPVWYSIDAEKPDPGLDALFTSVHADLLKGIATIICMYYDEPPADSEHFRLIVGYDARTDEVLYHEPAVARAAYKRMKREKLYKLWPLKYDEKEWTAIRLRLSPQQIREPAKTEGFTDADYAQAVHKLKRKAPEGFHFVIQKPFVVLGDETPAMVGCRSTGTIAWAVAHIKRQYFTKDPDDIVGIWLFKDKESYETNVEEIFGDKPHTPFGYYTHRHKALIMNISTGGGTLVHEIVHPFVASNFPDCPSWFNEGLASLYEQCGERNGRIVGYTNWRLRGLQKAIRYQYEPPPKPPKPEPAEGEEPEEEEEEEWVPVFMPTFEELCGTSTYEFYNLDPGTNYSQARYLCYYLQEHGLLNRYYHEFRRNVKEDPTGYKTLARVLDEEDMVAFQKKWEKWVMRLRF